jgi:hypothetical protein
MPRYDDDGTNVIDYEYGPSWRGLELFQCYRQRRRSANIALRRCWAKAGCSAPAPPPDPARTRPAQVLRRRSGIPITLCALLAAVCHRLGVALQPVSLGLGRIVVSEKDAPDSLANFV